MLRRIGRGGGTVDVALIVVFVFLLFVFFRRQGDPPSPDLQRINTPKRMAPPSGKIEKPAKEDTLAALIDERISRIPDTRPDICEKDVPYAEKEPVSIIIDFFDYSFYDLKMTIGSVLRNTPDELIGEILMIDDGSSLKYIREDSEKYAKKIPKARIVRIDEKVPYGRARLYGANEAKYKILVFLTTSVVCNVGWLKPLLNHLQQSPSSFAIPHMDNINDPVSYDYIKTPDNLVSQFTWSLSVVGLTLPDGKGGPKEHLESPVMAGDVFAINKDTLSQIGDFDILLQEQASISLELSFRAWRCGSALHVIPCSRVGVLTLSYADKVMQPEGIRRLAALWLSERNNVVFLSTHSKQEMTEEEKHEVQTRQKQLSALNCKTLDWYLNTIATEIFTPSKTVAAYGLLKVQNGHCARVGVQDRVDLGDCNHKTHKLKMSHMMFEYDNMLLKNKERCLTVHDNHYVTSSECVFNNTRQQWSYQNRVLKNIYSGSCAVHVTDPDQTIKKGRQILMAQSCEDDKDGKFSHWEFIVP